MKKRNIVIHIHIFKNAGTSFDDALKHSFGSTFVDHRDDQEMIKGKMEYLVGYLDAHSDIQALSSHSIHFFPKNNERYNFFPVYFLRHPIDRIRSVYNFEKKQLPAGTRGAVKAKELSFNDYIAWYMQEDAPATIRNCQTIFLSGDGPAPKNMEEKFQQAVGNMNRTPLIGIVDRFDESVVVFEENLKTIFSNIDLSYVRKNITDQNIEDSIEEKYKSVLLQLDDRTQYLVEKQNMLDSKLYATANTLLDAKVATMKHFQEKLDDFKDRCMTKSLRMEK